MMDDIGMFIPIMAAIIQGLWMIARDDEGKTT
jgi:hypothetical protein